MTCENATLPEILELSPRLEDADPGVRRLALIELADLELPEALPLLVAALRGDPDPGVRGEAARLLEAWEEDAVVDALCAALADPLPAVAEAAAQSLGELKEPAAGRRLLPWLEHADAFVRASVLRALRELRLEESAAPALAALGDPQAAVRREAVAVLGWLRHQPALAELARLASADADPEVRRAATGALGLSREAAVLPALCAALADAQWQVREEAATTLGKLGREEAGEPLLKALADDYWQVRLRAARSLGRLRHRPAREALEALLGHPIGNLRKEAALALGELADPPRPRPCGSPKATAIPRCARRCASPWRNCGCRHDPAAAAPAQCRQGRLVDSRMGGRHGQPDRPCPLARRLSLCAMPGAAPARTDRRGGAGRAPARYPPAGLRRAVGVRRWSRARYLPLVLSARRTLSGGLFRYRKQREARSWVSGCFRAPRSSP